MAERMGLPTAPPVRRKSVIEQVGDWLKPAAVRQQQEILNKMSTFKKKDVVRQRRMIYDVGGKKTISYWGAYVYLLNQFLDCLPTLPYLVLTAGWLPTFAANVFVCCIASFTSLMVLKSMTMIEGNQNFGLRYEYVPTAQHFLGSNVALGLEIGFHVLQILNFLAINSIARLVDLVLVQTVGGTCGLTLYPKLDLVVTSQPTLEELYTAEQGGVAFTLSLGYLLCCAVCIPLARYNMDDGITVQTGILGIVTVTCGTLLFSALRIGTLRNALESAATLFPPFLRKGILAQRPEQKQQPLRTSRSVLEHLGPSGSFQLSLACVDRLTMLTTSTSASWETVRDLSRKSSGSWVHMCGKCATSLCTEAGGSWPASIAAQSSAALWNPILSQVFFNAVRATAGMAKIAPSTPSVWGQRKFQSTFSALIGGYSVASVIPSWANELQENVNVPAVLWTSTISVCLIFCAFGWIIAWAFPRAADGSSDADALKSILARYSIPSYFAASVYCFEVVTVVLGVVVNCIATRYNLANSGLCGENAAFFFGCACPFMFAWIFAAETPLNSILDALSLILTLTCNFVAPLYVYITACKTSPLAFRNASRHKTIRLGIEAFQPHRGSVMDVQAALREWASTMIDEDPELRGLLESSGPSTRRQLSISSSGGIPVSNRTGRVSVRSPNTFLPPPTPTFVVNSSDQEWENIGTDRSVAAEVQDIRRRFTVNDILASYKHRVRDSSSSNPTLAPTSPVPPPSPNVSTSGLPVNWQAMVDEYERRLAAGDLEYFTSEESSGASSRASSVASARVQRRRSTTTSSSSRKQPWPLRSRRSCSASSTLSACDRERVAVSVAHAAAPMAMIARQAAADSSSRKGSAFSSQQSMEDAMLEALLDCYASRKKTSILESRGNPFVARDLEEQSRRGSTPRQRRLSEGSGLPATHRARSRSQPYLVAPGQKDSADSIRRLSAGIVSDDVTTAAAERAALLPDLPAEILPVSRRQAVKLAGAQIGTKPFSLVLLPSKKSIAFSDDASDQKSIAFSDEASDQTNRRSNKSEKG